MVGNANSDQITGSATNIALPDGFTKDNCVVVSIGAKHYNNKNYSYGTETADSSALYTRSNFGRNVRFSSTTNTIDLNCSFITKGTFINNTNELFYYRIVLMKI